MFLKEVSNAHQGCIYLVKILYCNIITISNNCFRLLNVMYSCDGIPVSHDPSKIILICWFAAQEMFRIIIIYKNRYAA